MKKLSYILTILLFQTSFAMLHTSCSTIDDDEIVDEAHTIYAIAPDLINDDGDPVLQSRSSLAYNTASKIMQFAWDKNDMLGVFDILVAPNAEDGSALSENMPFYYKSAYEGDATKARFQNGQFTYSTDDFWVACSPYLCNNGTNDERGKVTDYSNIRLTYRGQRQLVNARENEANGSKHLGAYDYMISTPTTPDAEDGRMTFNFDHVGATVRLYMRFPEGSFGGSGKKGYVKDISVIYTGSENPNPFVTDVTIGINQYTGSGESYSEKTGTRVTANKMTLACGTVGTKGIEVADHAYFITYMEFYPTWVEAESCYLFLTVEVDGVEHYFKSKPLEAKNIQAGHLVQWTTGNFNEPIELVTATLVPWEDLNGGEINTGE